MKNRRGDSCARIPLPVNNCKDTELLISHEDIDINNLLNVSMGLGNLEKQEARLVCGV